MTAARTSHCRELAALRSCAQCGGATSPPHKFCSMRCYADSMRGSIRGSLEERFWAKVAKSDGCWLWIGATDGKGYGQMRTRPGRLVRAPRVSYELHFGPIPGALFVCHHCDNPPCVRPEHLFLGTNSDNIRDMVAKGRTPDRSLPGEANPYAKLTWEIIKQIRSSDEGSPALARKYGVAHSTIRRIVTGKAWTKEPRP